jgi:hypothetical protein
MAEVFTADLSETAQVRKLYADVTARLGPPDLIVNNASVFENDKVSRFDENLFDRHFAIHLKAPAILAEAMANGLPDGREGLIVNIIDQRVWKLTPRFFSYTLSKSALWTATQTMAQALAVKSGCRTRPASTACSTTDGDVLYVGKARSLKKRVTNYTRPRPFQPHHAHDRPDGGDGVRHHAHRDRSAAAGSQPDQAAAPALQRAAARRQVVSLHPDGRRSRGARIFKHRGRATRKGDYFGPFASPARSTARSTRCRRRSSAHLLRQRL